ncbi:MAG: hypothetical protein OEZ39_04080 [Gammaproteobacteria bacterium]|nr:hypothetical protein [Gammaproteobacteria bacterium]MDH5651036.1 hypothetical protein [Gammaproteobacteria bacterium]
MLLISSTALQGCINPQKPTVIKRCVPDRSLIVKLDKCQRPVRAPTQGDLIECIKNLHNQIELDSGRKDELTRQADTCEKSTAAES